MKHWKLISGILCCVLFMFVSFQSCAAGVVDAMENEGGISGASGLILSIFMLTGGIVSIVTRESTNKGAPISLIIIFLIATIFGYAGSSNFADLQIWATWCLINLIMAIVNLIQINRRSKNGKNI